ncbi:MAG: hypothetical protein ACJ788_09500, partial [Ktedonobacteraceae bacterium]
QAAMLTNKTKILRSAARAEESRQDTRRAVPVLRSGRACLCHLPPHLCHRRPCLDHVPTSQKYELHPGDGIVTL